MILVDNYPISLGGFTNPCAAEKIRPARILVHMVEPDRTVTIDVGEGVQVYRGTIQDSVCAAPVTLPAPGPAVPFTANPGQRIFLARYITGRRPDGEIDRSTRTPEDHHQVWRFGSNPIACRHDCSANTGSRLAQRRCRRSVRRRR